MRAATLRQRALPLTAVAPLLALLFGCGAKLSAPTPAPTGDETPVELRSVSVADVEGHRAVLLRLSRVPTMVRYATQTAPAKIVVQAWGPAAGGDLPERVMPQTDPQIAQVRVSRQAGSLMVVLELYGDKPPPYTVHEMADWIMIRLQPLS